MSDTWSADPLASHSFGRIPRLATYVDEILCVDSLDLGCGARVMRQSADEFGGRIGTPLFGECYRRAIWVRPCRSSAADPEFRAFDDDRGRWEVRILFISLRTGRTGSAFRISEQLFQLHCAKVP